MMVISMRRDLIQLLALGDLAGSANDDRAGLDLKEVIEHVFDRIARKIFVISKSGHP